MGVTSDLKEIEREMNRLALQLRLELTEKEKCDYTSGHLVRTAEYAVGIAKVLKLNKELIEKIKRGAELHDAGKLYIDNDLLLSDKKFTKDEKVKMKKHPEYGMRWLKENMDIEKVPKEIMNIILHHHEDWNDDGYPNGLYGARIPFVARLVRVADSWDAITSDRPYMKGMTHEDAIEDMKKRSGIKYEPMMINAFLKFVGAN